METQKDEAINFGRSLIVPSVQELARQSITEIPPRYVHHQLVNSVSSWLEDLSVPVIDLQCLFGESSASYSSELNKLHAASKEWGFFQVINHGISESLLEDLKREVLEFFKLPMEEKQKLWQKEDNQEGFGQLFVVSEEQKLDWEKLEAYSGETKRVAVAILGEMGKALGIDTEEMRGLFEDGVQQMRMNYYLPCPRPELALGLSPHSDADALTLLYQLNDTPGLQIRKDGKWLTVKTLTNSLIVNIGDIMEIVSNGAYKSIEHPAIVNTNAERISVATFYSSNMGTEIGPAHSLVAKDNVAKFKRVPLEPYFKNFFARKLDGKSFLDFMKSEQ